MSNYCDCLNRYHTLVRLHSIILSINTIKMIDCYVFLGIKNNNGVYNLPIGYSNGISQRRGGKWHIELTDITLKVISDDPLHAIIGCDLCQDSAFNNRLILVLRFLSYLRKNDSVIFTNILITYQLQLVHQLIIYV